MPPTESCRNGISTSCSVFSGRALAGSAVIFLGGVLAAGGGLGGGGIFIPALVLVAGFSPHVAIPVSKITIFGVAIGGLAVNYSKRHPSADRPLISYDTAMILEPATLLGTVIGVFFNVVFPAWLIVIFLVLLLTYAAKRTLAKGRRLRAKELQRDADSGVAGEVIMGDVKASDSADSLEGGTDDGDDHNKEEEEYGGEEEDDDAASTDADALDAIYARERRSIPWGVVGLLTGTLAVVSVLVFLKGGTDGSSAAGVRCGTFVYWLLVLLVVPFLGVVTHRIGLHLQAQHAEKERLGYRYAEGDVRWTRRMVTRFPPVAVLAGVAAGFLGIGGGMVKGPLMIELGMVPSVAAATSSFMIVFTSFSTSFQYVVLGRMPEFAWWYFLLGLVSAVLGHKGVGYMLRRYRKQSYVSFLIAGAIVVSVVAMAALEILQVKEDVDEGASMGFHALCGSE